MKTTALLIAATALLAAGVTSAQLVPALPRVGEVAGALTRDAVALPARAVQTLADARLDRITALVRANPGRIERDPDGFAARAHEVVASDPDDALIAAATGKGFRLIERTDALGIGFARFETPRGMSLKAAIRALGRLGGKEVSADQLHFESGVAGPDLSPQGGAGPLVGMIDGGVAGGVAMQRGFTDGAPRASAHGAAVASLIAGSARIRGGAPGARLFVADVYGGDPAGGSATAIARALAWLTDSRAPVVTISLVGPPNPLLGRVVAAAQARGVIVVAAVGNDGPAAPPSYPASYPGVIAVTGVDGRKRILIEAGRASHLDYAAPAADMIADDGRGGATKVRGTSFAAPLVAASIARVYLSPDPRAHAAALARVDATAEKLGKHYGRGLVCGDCATPAR